MVLASETPPRHLLQEDADPLTVGGGQASE